MSGTRCKGTKRTASKCQFLSKRIVLIDGEHLAKLMIRYNVGCRIEEVLHIKKVDEDFFE
jgi:restriction system protein